jgi:hypothetical protein
MSVTKLDRFRLRSVKRAFSTRRVPPERMQTLITGNLRPAAGDLVLARVDMLGKQSRIELTDGRRAYLFPKDQIVVCYGNRYAPDQYEAVIGGDMSPCDLVAAGGVAGIELSRHQRMIAPTKITPIGLVGDEQGNRLNLRSFGVEAADAVPKIPAILSLGTSMNAGKTVTATSLVRGLKQFGYSVAALKITGTGSGGDMWIVQDAGADVALDFGDAGFATTYLAPIDDIERGAFRLLNHAASLGCDIAVIEIADGLQQLETSQLIRSEAIRQVAIGTVFASYDAMGAKNGVDLLHHADHAVLALSGRLGRSPLGVREAETATGIRVYSPWELQEGVLVPAIRAQAAECQADPRFRHLALEKLAVAGSFSATSLPLTQRSANNGQCPVPIGLENLPAAVALDDTRFVGFTPAPQPERDQARDLLAKVAAHIMRNDIAHRCGASHGTRHSGRTNWRNGSRPTRWVTAFGQVSIKVPKLRHGRYTPPFFGRTSLDDNAMQVRSVIAVLQAISASDFEVALRDLVESHSEKPFSEDEYRALATEVRILLNGSGSDEAMNVIHVRNKLLMNMPLGRYEAGIKTEYDEDVPMDEEFMSADQLFQSPHAIAGE